MALSSHPAHVCKARVKLFGQLPLRLRTAQRRGLLGVQHGRQRGMHLGPALPRTRVRCLAMDASSLPRCSRAWRCGRRRLPCELPRLGTRSVGRICRAARLPSSMCGLPCMLRTVSQVCRRSDKARAVLMAGEVCGRCAELPSMHCGTAPSAQRLKGCSAYLSIASKPGLHCLEL